MQQPARPAGLGALARRTAVRLGVPGRKRPAQAACCWMASPSGGSWAGLPGCLLNWESPSGRADRRPEASWRTTPHQESVVRSRPKVTRR